MNSTPTFNEFDPETIPFQDQVIDDVFEQFDYSEGSHEILLSGSVGSAKSILMAHIAVKICCDFPGAKILYGRKAMPDLKDTIFRKTLDHMYDTFIEGVHYKVRENTANIIFSNKSEIISRSWSDNRYEKVRSLDLTAAFIEELSENDDDDKRAYDEIAMRVGRTPHIPIQFIMAATNPDEPDMWIYKHFIANSAKNRHVYYSRTEENPFLPRSYIETLKRNLDPMMVRRMLYGEWLSIQGQNIYYSYNREVQYLKKSYQINSKFPIICTWDFNSAMEKPMSLVLMQYIDDTFHIFDEVIIYGGRTLDTLDELDNKNYVNLDLEYWICGDAAGKHRDTRSLRSDYDIIINWFKEKGLKYRYIVPASNPPIRARHNIVNAYFKNSLNEIRCFVYEKAKTVDEGFRLTKLKDGAHYIEDDSKPYQHCTCACGYAMVYIYNMINKKPQGTVRL